MFYFFTMPSTFGIKIKNIARVLDDLNADIVALQEIESEKALLSLRKHLKVYPHQAIADSRKSAVKCALLSKYPILFKNEIAVGRASQRNILKVTLDLQGNPFIVYVNHWKSKSGPESLRVEYARVLAADLKTLGERTDFILIGDFNSDYNEYETIKKRRRLNDTNGITGINHILMTIKENILVNESDLMTQRNNTYLYNLWMELPVRKRWSTIFFGKKNTHDAIIVSKGLYDDKGISYVDNSFNRFDPDYLFKNHRIYRWQRSKKGKGEHLGKGYSDHLPVYAKFFMHLPTAKPDQVKNCLIQSLR